MTDKVLCPWCGAEMRYKQLDHINGFYDCPQCLATGPAGRGEADARSAALRRYEPPCGPMTIEEIKERRERKDANPMWIEWRLSPEKSGWILSKTMNALTIEYNNFLWRCWPHKPTDEEREAYGWENDDKC